MSVNTWTKGNIGGSMEIGARGSESGGGSGDFTTAKVIISSSENHNETIYIPYAGEWDGEYFTNSEITPTTNAIEVDTILYHGNCFAAYYGEGTVVVTGDIEDDDGELYITGDGTITINY